MVGESPYGLYNMYLLSIMYIVYSFNFDFSLANRLYDQKLCDAHMHICNK